jgi:hypothetical protein
LRRLRPDVADGLSALSVISEVSPGKVIELSLVGSVRPNQVDDTDNTGRASFDPEHINCLFNTQHFVDIIPEVGLKLANTVW